MKKIKHTVLLFALWGSALSTKAQSIPAIYDTNDSISNIVLPNVFTPNFDSINDVFKPYLDEITECSFSIYNRYGNLVFETSKLNGFWDGRTTSGEPCQDGVYFCVLTATGVDGKKFKEKTFVQLFTGGFYRK